MGWFENLGAALQGAAGGFDRYQMLRQLDDQNQLKLRQQKMAEDKAAQESQINQRQLEQLDAAILRQKQASAMEYLTPNQRISDPTAQRLNDLQLGDLVTKQHFDRGFNPETINTNPLEMVKMLQGRPNDVPQVETFMEPTDINTFEGTPQQIAQQQTLKLNTQKTMLELQNQQMQAILNGQKANAMNQLLRQAAGQGQPSGQPMAPSEPFMGPLQPGQPNPNQPPQLPQQQSNGFYGNIDPVLGAVAGLPIASLRVPQPQRPIDVNLPGGGHRLMNPQDAVAQGLSQYHPPSSAAQNNIPAAVPVYTNDSPEGRMAKDLAYGKLTLQQLNQTLSSRGASGAAQRAGIYDLAKQINPNFDPAAFAAGYKFATTPANMQALTAIDSVTPNLDRVIELARNAGNGGSTGFNAIVNKGKYFFGNKRITDFSTLQKIIGDELGVALGRGTVTDMSRELGLDIANMNLPFENFVSTIEEIRNALNNRRGTYLPKMGIYGEQGRIPGVNDNGQQGNHNPAPTNLPPAGAVVIEYDNQGNPVVKR